MAKKQFNIDGQEISIRQVNSKDYLSLTDMAKVNRPKSRAIDLDKFLY